MVEIWLPYGSSEIPVRVTDERLLHILKPKKVETKPNAAEELSQLVQSHEYLVPLIKESKQVCIAMGESSSKQVLIDLTGRLLTVLRSIRADDESLFVLTTPSAEKIDSSVLREVQIVHHDPSSSPTVTIEEAKVGFRPMLNAAFVNADLKIVLGELKPHHFLGFWGIPDVVFPGLAAEASVRAELTNRKDMQSSKLHEERIRIASSISNLVAVGFVLDGDQQPVKMSLGSVGDCVSSLKAPLEDVCATRVEKQADIVVMSAGGAPQDESLLRAMETLPAGLAAVKKDGVVIVAAECPMGHGNTEFYEWCAERKEPRHLEMRLRHSFNYYGLLAVSLLRALQEHRIYLVSTVPDYYVEKVFGMKSAETVNAALSTAQRYKGADSTISVVPDGSRLLFTSESKVTDSGIKT